MKNLDLYWASNNEWWELKNHVRVLKDDAPLDAKISYENYLKQKGKPRFADDGITIVENISEDSNGAENFDVIDLVKRLQTGERIKCINCENGYYISTAKQLKFCNSFHCDKCYEKIHIQKNITVE